MANMKEQGRIGHKRYNGTFYEEFLKELRGRKGAEVYREMSENDDTIGAILFAVEMLIRQADWKIEPAGDTAKDKEAAEFIQQCMDDMQETWIDTISEILSFLTFGWSYHEIVYKLRRGKTNNPKTNSKYSDGLIGWRKLPIRAQETLYEWEFDEEDNLIAMVQEVPPTYGRYRIEKKKALLFRTKNRKGNPEGRSILRNAYRSWYFKKHIQEIEGIGIERDLAGLPVLYGPEDMGLWDIDDPEAVLARAELEKMVKGLRRDEMEGVVLPHGYKLELLSSSGSRQFDTNKIIDRYDTRMAMTVLADFIFLGHQQVGSFALSSDKTELFAMAIGAYLDIICETFNGQGIPQLIDVNGQHFQAITDYPKMIHGDVESRNLEELSKFLKDMVGTGIIIPDDELEDHIREEAQLPGRSFTGEGSRNVDDARRLQQNKPQPPNREVNPEDNDPDESEVKAAMKRLGRG